MDKGVAEVKSMIQIHRGNTDMHPKVQYSQTAIHALK